MLPRGLAHLIARVSGDVSRRLGRGGGTTLPGVVLLRLRPRAVEDLAARLPLGSITVSATNGKTTTARLLRSILDANGVPTVANTAGSNLLRGVAAALLADRGHAEFGLFEVDEAALPSTVEQLHPRAVVLMNLFRDQLDRYGELETLVATWRTMIAGLPAATTLVLNADDPAVAHLGADRADVVWFGLDDVRHGRATLAHASDSTSCPVCDTALSYDLITIGHMGHWRCGSCGLRRPTPTVSLARVDLRGLDRVAIEALTPDGRVVAELALPGLHNAYNAGAAIAAAIALELPLETVGPALSVTAAAFGRGEHLRLDHRSLVLLLAKNPAGANENVRAVLSADGPLHLLLMLNDRTADGQDVSWIWDVDYEPLFERVASVTVTGDRAADLALRLVYGGLDRARVHVVDGVADAVDHAIATTPPGATLYALPTYTAMLELRSELVRRGVAQAFWEDA